jgi:hypothetical protein
MDIRRSFLSRNSFVPRRAGRFSQIVLVTFIVGAALIAASTASAGQTGEPQCPCTLWDPASTAPSVIDSEDPNGVELGVKFRSDVSGYITGIRFYKSAANTGLHTANLWTSNGIRMATATFANESATGWQEVRFASPVFVVANVTYVASYHAPNGRYSLDDGYFAAGGVDNGPLHAPRAGTSGNGVYRYGPGGFPDLTWGGSNYWVDVVFDTTVPQDSTPPQVTSTLPAAGATDANPRNPIVVSFNEPIDRATVSPSTFQLRDAANSFVDATWSWDATTNSAHLVPRAPLAYSSSYSVLVRGGVADPRIKDVAGNALPVDVAWNFSTAALAVCPCSIWDPAVDKPAVVDAGDGNAVELGVKFYPESPGYITGLRFYKSAANTGTHIGNLWTAGGSLIATAPFVNETASGWQEVRFQTPVAVAANTVYVASYHTSTGHYSITSGYFDNHAEEAPPLRALSNFSLNGVYRYGASGFPNFSFEATNYWVDVVFSPTIEIDTIPPRVIAMSPVSGSTSVPRTTPITATFSEPIDPSTVTTTTFELVDSMNSRVGSTVSYDAASRTVTLTPSMGMLLENETYTVRIRGGNESPRILDEAGNPMGSVMTWSFSTVSPPPVSPPPFVVTQFPRPGSTDVRPALPVTATFNEPMDPSSVTTTTFQLLDPMNNLVPASVTYDAASFTARLTPSSSLLSNTKYTVRVRGGNESPRVLDVDGNSMAATSTWVFTTEVPRLKPAPFALPYGCVGCSLWAPALTKPAVIDSGDSSSVEVGVKFRPTISGAIMGVRFYKSAANTGPHIVNVWSMDGQRLATATATNESASGWQEVLFRDRFASVVAGNTYIVSYHTDAGHYSVDDNYFTSAVTTTALTAPSNDETPNGVYVYGDSAFPAFSYSAANYWVDPVFGASPGETFPIEPVVLEVSPDPGGVITDPNADVTVRFNFVGQLTIINTETIHLVDETGMVVPATITFDKTTVTATVNPAAALTAGARYTLVVRGTHFNDPVDATFTTPFTVAGPATCPCSIWPASAVPEVIDENDGNAVELGVKFKTDIDGFITGVRFYKSAANTGVHTGSLWTSSGALLATVTFTDETDSGWQEARFATPVRVAANTEYVVSYHTETGHYSRTGGYFGTGGGEAGPVHAIATSSNGVYAYGASSFPTSSYNATNYWVDVVFEQ